MRSFVGNIEEEARENNNFRKVLFTAPHSQLVVMSLASSEDIGEEVHEVDQFIRIEQGSGKAVLDSEEYSIEDGWAVLIPAGTRHNIINTGEDEMKIYTLYAPAQHPDGTIHETKEDAMAEEKTE